VFFVVETSLHMKRCPATVIMYMTIHFQKWKLKKYQKEILNVIDSFNVESDEEFLGFEVLCLLTNEL
jgi:hypothetical protein